MITSHQRMIRMRKSFEKTKTVLTVYYKYFTTPDAPATPRVSIHRSKVAHRSAELSAPRVHRVETAVETKHEFIEVGLQMTRFYPAVVSAVDPRLQVGEDKMDHRQVLLRLLWVASQRERVVPIAHFGIPSLWNGRPPRRGRQSPAPRRSRQRDTVIWDAAKAGFDPSASLCQALADLAGGSAGLAGNEPRR